MENQGWDTDYKPKRMSVMFALWLLGGWLGAQRLYVRDYAMAVVFATLGLGGVLLTFSPMAPLGIMMFAAWVVLFVYDMFRMAKLIAIYNYEGQRVRVEPYGTVGMGITKAAPLTPATIMRDHIPQPEPRHYDPRDMPKQKVQQTIAPATPKVSTTDESRKRREHDEEDARARRRRDDDDAASAASSAALTSIAISTDFGGSGYDSGSSGGSIDAGGGSFGGGGSDSSF